MTIAMSAAAAMTSCRLLVVLMVLTQTTSAVCPESDLRNCTCHFTSDKNVVDCSKQELRVPPLGGSDKYEHVVLAGNRLHELSDDSLAVFPNVQVLDLSNNVIRSLHPGSFGGVHWLEMLDLSSNELGLALHCSMNSSQLLASNGVKWLSFANNKRIGEELQQAKVENNANMTAWLNIPSLRNLSLANCKLTRLPMWMLIGMPGLEFLDISKNKLLVLPVLTLVSTCRLKSIALAGNPWNCGKCENFRSINLMKSKIIGYGKNYCSLSKFNDKNCNVNFAKEEKNVESVCYSKVLPVPLVYQAPKSAWFYFGIAAGGLVALVIISFLVCSLRERVCFNCFK